MPELGNGLVVITVPPVADDPGLVVRVLGGPAVVLGVVSTKTDLTPAAPTFATVGLVSAMVVAANATRTGLILVNTSSARISLGFGSPAVLDSGATLLPPGGAFNMSEYDFDQGAVFAIASKAGSNLAIQEYST
jgi:hypothetical protein